MEVFCMKITDKIISIPPYISTSWEKISSLYLKEKDLVIILKDNTPIAIPNLSNEVIEEIFSAHAAFLEQQLIKRPAIEPMRHEAPQASESPLALPFRLFFGTLESLNQALHHNPNYSDLPPFPPDIVSKIELLAKAVPLGELANMPNPEPGCNCLYCQMMRLLKKGEASEDEPSDDEVSDEELRFEQWEIQSLGDKLYLVTNKLDKSEAYRVFLGDPIGCTCGKPNCEHIIAVLRH